MLTIYIDGRRLKGTVAKPNSYRKSSRVFVIAAYSSHRINQVGLYHTVHGLSSSEHMNKVRHDLILNLWKSSGNHQGGKNVRKQLIPRKLSGRHPASSLPPCYPSLTIQVAIMILLSPKIS